MYETTTTENKTLKAILYQPNILESFKKAGGFNNTTFVKQIASSALMEICKNKKLQECTSLSIVQAVTKACAYKLMIGVTYGHFYLIPMGKSCEGWISYKGLVQTAYNIGFVKEIGAVTVYENDEFEYSNGFNKTFYHKPKLNGDRGKVICYAAFATLQNGGKVFEIVDMDSFEATKRFAASKNPKLLTDPNNPWLKFPHEMGMKTAVRKILKYTPQYDFNDVASSILLGKEIESYDTFEPTDEVIEAPIIADSSETEGGEQLIETDLRMAS